MSILGRYVIWHVASCEVFGPFRFMNLYNRFKVQIKGRYELVNQSSLKENNNSKFNLISGKYI